MKARIREALALVVRFFKAAPGAIPGHLNLDELARVVAFAIATGGTTYEVLEVVLTDPNVYVDSTAGAVIVAALTAGLDTYRRLKHAGPGLGMTRAREDVRPSTPATFP